MLSVHRIHLLRRARTAGGRVSGTIFVLGLMLLIMVLLLAYRISPLVEEMAVAEVRNEVTTAVNHAIAERMSEGELTYHKLVSVEKDSTGEVSAIVTNMSYINQLQAKLSNSIITEVSKKETAELYIPSGNLIGGVLFSGRGPGIPVKIVSVGAVSTNFRNVFESTGINQTLHQIVLDVLVTVSILLPGNTVSAEVEASVTVAETVLVGDVPESYMYFEGSENWDSNLEKFDILH